MAETGPFWKAQSEPVSSGILRRHDYGRLDVDGSVQDQRDDVGPTVETNHYRSPL